MKKPIPLTPAIAAQSDAIVQVALTSTDATHTQLESMTTWVDKRPGLREGVTITLKDYPDTKWYVAKLWPQEHWAKDFDWHRIWTNNI